MGFFEFTIGDLFTFIFLGVALLCCHMVAMSRLDGLEGKVDLLVKLTVGSRAPVSDNPARPAPAPEEPHGADRRD